MLDAAWTRGQAASYLVTIEQPEEVSMEYVTAVVKLPTEVQIPTVQKCRGWCGRHLVMRKRWKQISRDVRRQIQPSFAEAKARGLCDSCYRRARQEDVLIDFESKIIPGVIFAEEYNAMRKQNMTDYSIRLALKMSVDAFEKALQRNADRIVQSRSAERITPKTYEDGSFGKSRRSTN